MIRHLPDVFVVLFLLGCDSAVDQKARYLRPAKDGWDQECTFTIRREDRGWTIRSVTERGETKLNLFVNYDSADKLRGAEVTLLTGDRKKTARVEVENGKARVFRDGQAVQDFEVPKGVIVTSAPDWTDVFLLCQRYDSKRGGKQTFPGLWIHPTQAAQRLDFTIERVGSEWIQRGEGMKLQLDCFTIRLRNQSEYRAWADAKGRLIRLISLPAKESETSGLVLEGFEKIATQFRSE